MRADLAELRRAGREADVALAKADARRRALRQLEHELDVGLRQSRDRATHGLEWAEVRRGTCQRCRVQARLWVGSWFEYAVAPGRPPVALVSIPFLCAVCAVRCQLAERTKPIWRARRARRSP